RPDGNTVESLSLNAAASTLAATDGLTVSYTASTGGLLTSGSAAQADYQAVLQGVLYNDTSDTPNTTNRTVTVVVSDGSLSSASNSVPLGITPVNDAPVTDLDGAGTGSNATASFTEQTPVLIAPSATVSDVDSPSLASMTVTLTNRPDGNTVESLSLNAAASTLAATDGLTVSYTASTGVLLISGSAAQADYQAILQGGLYNDTSDTPNTANRTVTVVVSDGSLSSASNSVTIGITPVNDAPVTDLNGAGTGSDATASFTEQTPVLIAPSATVSDVDSPSLASMTVTLTNRPDGNTVESLSLNAAASTLAATDGLTVSYTASTGVLLLSGSAAQADYQAILQGVLYNDTSDTPNTTNRTVTVVVSDGSLSSASNSVTIGITPFNARPVSDLNGAGTGSNATASFTEQTPVLIAPSATVSDVDS